MNILFVLYGDFSTNTSIHISAFANELSLLGHECVIAIPSNSAQLDNSDGLYNSLLFDELFRLDGRVFSNGKRADVIHASTPRIVIRKFINSYLINWPTLLVLHLEDDELHIALNFLGVNKHELAQLSTEQLDLMLPDAVTHPHELIDLISRADLVLLVQEKLEILLPPSTYFKTIYWGVDKNSFFPKIAPSQKWKDYFGIEEDDKVIVYHGGLNSVNAYAIVDLCHAVEIINKLGFKCKLIRTGPNPFYFWDELSPNAKKYIFETGVVDREELPSILALADLYVQPGRINSFEDLRFPSKMIEFFSMGRPVIMPAVHIADEIEDNIDAIVLPTGTPEEIANACIRIFSDPDLSARMGIGARKFALKHFNIKKQTQSLLEAYQGVIALYNKKQ